MTLRSKSVSGALSIIMLYLMIASCVPPDGNGPPQTPRVVVVGRVLNRADNKPIEGASVAVPDVQDILMFTNENGEFRSDNNTKPYDPNKPIIVIRIEKTGYTFKGHETGMNKSWAPGYNNLGDFRLDSIKIGDLGTNIDVLPETEKFPPRERGSEPRILSIKIEPSQEVDRISEVRIDGEMWYRKTEKKESREVFVNGEIFFESGRSHNRTLELLLEGFPGKKLEFDDTNCDHNTPLRIIIGANGSIEKRDCR
tara:strand:+ start:4408 stop:5169 length:762 start_codon:yes stop_codon:yes gene_type:complete